MRELHYYWQVCQALRAGGADDAEYARMELEGIVANTTSPRLKTLCLEALADSATRTAHSLKC